MYNGVSTRRNYLSMDNAAQSREVADDKIDEIVKELSELKESGVRSFINLESYLRWYQNVYGLIALELMIEECREAIKQKKNRELIAIINKLAQMRQHHARFTGEVTDFSAEDDQKILAPLPGMSEDFSELDAEQVRKIIAEYEQYFDELDLDVVVNTVAASRSLGEDGFISFDEIAALVKSVEERMALLVKAGEISEEKASLIVGMVHAIDIQRFAGITLEEQKELIAKVAELDVDEVRDLIIEINEREPVVNRGDDRLFDEGGFVSFDEMAVLMKSVEERLALLVEAGEITKEKAQVIIDMVNNIDLERFAEMTQVEKKELIASIADLDFDEMRDVIIDINEREPLVNSERNRLFDEAGFVEVGGISNSRERMRNAEQEVDSPRPIVVPQSMGQTQADFVRTQQMFEQQIHEQQLQQLRQVTEQRERQRQVQQEQQLEQQTRQRQQQDFQNQQAMIAHQQVQQQTRSSTSATTASTFSAPAAVAAAVAVASPLSPVIDNSVFVTIGTRDAPAVTPATPTQTTTFAPDAFMQGPPNFHTETFQQKEAVAAQYNQQPSSRDQVGQQPTTQKFDDDTIGVPEATEVKINPLGKRGDHEVPNEPTDEVPVYDKEPPAEEHINICDACPFKAMCGTNKPCASPVLEQSPLQVMQETALPPLMRTL